MPVLLDTLMQMLVLAPDALIVDLTFGQGGYAQAFLKRYPDCRYFGFDRDPQAVSNGLLWTDTYPGLCLAQADFTAWPIQLPSGQHPDAVIMDLGISSTQLDDPRRGFSFQLDSPLDMRMNPADPQNAASLLAATSAAELETWLRTLVQLPMAGRIAARICERRPMKSSGELKRAVLSALPKMDFYKRQQILSQVFLALRMRVNRELEQLAQALPLAWLHLKPGGTLAVVSFQSAEDKQVKNFARSIGLQKHLSVKASRQEQRDNPRSRSARLRLLPKKTL